MTLRLVKGGNAASVDLPLFDSLLDRSGRRQLRSIASLFAVERGQIVAQQGDVDQDFLVIADGILKLWKDLPDRRPQIIAFRAGGDLVSLHRCESPWPVTAQAITDCRLVRIDWSAFRRLARNHPVLDQALLDLARDEITNIQDRLLTLGRRTTEEKLASFMLEFCRPSVVPSSLNREIQLPMRRPDIAEYLGLTTESISREFSRFKKQRIIAMPRPSRIIVLNWPALEAIAAGTAIQTTRADEREAGVSGPLVASE